MLIGTQQIRIGTHADEDWHGQTKGAARNNYTTSHSIKLVLAVHVILEPFAITLGK